MRDILNTLARDAAESVDHGYYNIHKSYTHISLGLKESILKSTKNPIIAEIKVASPSKGIIAKNIDIVSLSQMMLRGGATALSILTEPKHFLGKIEYMLAAREIGLPRLMKDIIIDPMQVEAAVRVGAEAILLIASVFERGLGRASLNEMIDIGHKGGIEVLLETHTKEEFEKALSTEADLIGINNRDLSSFKTNIEVTKNILDSCDANGRVVVTESGIENQEHIRLLRESGANAFLVGSSIMTAANPEQKLRELVEA